ncbi:MAG: hypothetical protein K6F78_00515 [Bacteroidaceae bacterium]|nr:hypothetical protein [Bacteroidaceae bacterium]
MAKILTEKERKEQDERLYRQFQKDGWKDVGRCGTPMEYEHDRMMAEREKKERSSSSAPVPEEAPKEK